MYNNAERLHVTFITRIYLLFAISYQLSGIYTQQSYPWRSIHAAISTFGGFSNTVLLGDIQHGLFQRGKYYCLNHHCSFAHSQWSHAAIF